MINDRILSTDPEGQESRESANRVFAQRQILMCRASAPPIRLIGMGWHHIGPLRVAPLSVRRDSGSL